MTGAMPPELAVLAERFELVTEEVRVGDRTLPLERPRSSEALISEEDFARDERLPYWAELWPSARVLAQVVAGGSPGDGRRALELGCGLGLVSIAAMRAGWDVTATDYYEDALRFTARNALAAAGSMPVTRLVDWRRPPDNLGTFDLVLAADVLYERPYAVLVTELVARALAPRGRMLLADQGRVGLGAFLEEMGGRGFGRRIVRVVAMDGANGGVEPRVTVYELARQVRRDDHRGGEATAGAGERPARR